eukprot:TRINITY_DN10219_c0_g1_i1.p1 TRINITY_DN10219_c0_g1~~TRINITY_DN10219_c0_g1_i1.p1  ORF type:complete len:677 (+),score=188.48 TRINITY_DN10219_c0_g1_i1:343-2373(+)
MHAWLRRLQESSRINNTSRPNKAGAGPCSVKEDEQEQIGEDAKAGNRFHNFSNSIRGLRRGGRKSQEGDQDDMAATERYIESLQAERHRLMLDNDHQQQRVAILSSKLADFEQLQGYRRKDMSVQENELLTLRHEVANLKEDNERMSSEQEQTEAKLRDLRSCLKDALQKRDEDANIQADLNDKLRQTQMQLALAQASSASAQGPELPADLGLDDLTQMYKEQFERMRDKLTDRDKELSEAKEEMQQLRAELQVSSKRFYTLLQSHLGLIEHMSSLPDQRTAVKPWLDEAHAIEMEAIAGPQVTTSAGADDDDEGSDVEPSDVQYDEFGFPLETDPDIILMRLKHRTEEIENIAWWEDYMQGDLSELFHKSTHAALKKHIRMGIPSKYRAQVWRHLVRDVSAKMRSFQKEGYYNDIVDYAMSKKTSESIRQIEQDLLRTFPNNRNFKDSQSPIIKRLYRVLVAYSFAHRNVGYCQGMNQIAALLLLFMDEEDAFWGLSAVVEKILPRGYYSKTMIGAQADQRICQDFLVARAPKLHSHLSRLEIDTSMVTFDFLLTSGVDTVPFPTVLRIWDCFLFEGAKILFRFTLALFKTLEPELLTMQDRTDVLIAIKPMCQRTYDTQTLFKMAFKELKNFSDREIADKRSFYTEQIELEMSAFQEEREKRAKAREEEEASNA